MLRAFIREFMVYLIHLCLRNWSSPHICQFRGLSLPVTFVHRAQTAEDIDTISFAYDSPISHPDHDKIWLVNAFLPVFCPK